MTAEQQLERSVLEGKERDELHAIAQAMSLKTTTRTKKADIIDQILEATGVERRSGRAAPGGASRPRHGTAGRRRRPRGRPRPPTARRPHEAERPVGADDGTDDDRDDDAPGRPATGARRPASPADGRDGRAPVADGRRARRRPGAGDRRWRGPTEAADAAGDRAPAWRQRTRGHDGQDRANQRRAPAEPASQQNQRQQPARPPTTAGQATHQASGSGEPGQPPGPPPPGPRPAAVGARAPGRRRARSAYQGELVEVRGLLDLRDEGYGFLRCDGYLPSTKDVYVSISQARRFALRKGDYVEGACRPAANNEKYPALLRIDKVSGLDPEEARNRPRFEDLTPLFPDEKLRLETARGQGQRDRPDRRPALARSARASAASSSRRPRPARRRS